MVDPLRSSPCPDGVPALLTLLVTRATVAHGCARVHYAPGSTELPELFTAEFSLPFGLEYRDLLRGDLCLLMLGDRHLPVSVVDIRFDAAGRPASLKLLGDIANEQGARTA
ncbi:MAG: hypothetical protein ACHQXA_09370 [Gemmatimonadales bacterium]|jgi:hypothetical protein